MNKNTILKLCSWALGIAVVVLTLIVWMGERLSGGTLSTYGFFPLLGLLAFSLMWTHYVLGLFRRTLQLSAKENRHYFKATSTFVLVCIVAHPALLITQLYSDGFGLPPQSYLSVYATSKLALLMGSVGLSLFLLFELKRWFKLKMWWKYIEYAQLVAMALIFFHGLSLGRELSVGWYRLVWYMYGVSFVIAACYNYWYDLKGTQHE